MKYDQQQRDFRSPGDRLRDDRAHKRYLRSRQLWKRVPGPAVKWWRALAEWAPKHEAVGLVLVLAGSMFSLTFAADMRNPLPVLAAGGVVICGGVAICWPALRHARRTGLSQQWGWMAETGITLAWAWFAVAASLWWLSASGGLPDDLPTESSRSPVVALAAAAITAGLVGLSVQRVPERSWDVTTDDTLFADVLRQRILFAVVAAAGAACLVLVALVALLSPRGPAGQVLGAMTLYSAAVTAVSLFRTIGEFLSGLDRSR